MLSLKVYWPNLVATILTSVPVYIAILTIIDDLPENDTQRLWIYIGVLLFSVIVAGGSNYFAFLSRRESEKQAKKAEENIRAIRERLRPILIEPLDAELARSAKSLRDISNGQRLEFYVFAFVDCRWRVLASTKDSSSVVRRIALDQDEGVIGLTAQNESPIVVEIRDGGKGKVFNRHNEVVAEQRELSPDNRSKTDTGIDYIAATPVFVKNVSEPYDKTIIGVLSVDCYTKEGGVPVPSHAFQEQLDAEAIKVSPYLSVFHEISQLNGDEPDR